jgi:hypothetical protein
VSTTAQFPADCARKFRPERLLGSGGYGQVWLAHQLELDRRVVVKLLHAETAAQPEAVERFRTEAQVTALLRHPNIVLVIDHGAEEGLPWIAYEFIEGHSLRARLDAGSMPWREACTMGVQVASALEAAHVRGVLHRDIKPDNVLEAGPGDWRVADFGIAKWSGSVVKTEAGMVLGTPAYLSPQQLRGLVPAFESDVYALGVMLYEAVAGKLPWWDENLALLLQRRLTIAAPAPSAAQGDVPAELDRVILKMIAPQREDRIATAQEVRTALERILGERPSQRTRALTRPASKAGGRLPTGVAPVLAAPAAAPARPAWHLAAAAVAAFVGIGGVAWMALRAPAPVPSPSPVVVTSPTPAASASAAEAFDPVAMRREIQRSFLAVREAFRPVLLKRQSSYGAVQFSAYAQAANDCLKAFRALVRSGDTSVVWLDLLVLVDQTIDDGMSMYPTRFDAVNSTLKNIAREAGAIPAGVFPGVFRAVVVARIEILMAHQGERDSERMLTVYEAAVATVETATGAEWQRSAVGLGHRTYLACELLRYRRRKDAILMNLNDRSPALANRARMMLALIDEFRNALVARPALLSDDPDGPFAFAIVLHAMSGVMDCGGVNRPADSFERARALLAVPVPATVRRDVGGEIVAVKERLQERVDRRSK